MIYEWYMNMVPAKTFRFQSYHAARLFNSNLNSDQVIYSLKFFHSHSPHLRFEY